MCHTVCGTYHVPHRNITHGRRAVRQPPARAAKGGGRRGRPGRAPQRAVRYTLRKALAEQGLAIDEGTLYPLLRRLETQGLLVSEWREEEKRNKRFYRLSADGADILKRLLAEWKSIDASLTGILKERRRGTSRSVLAGS